MPSYRYPGPRPFEENDINLFFGREKDKKNLLTFINVEQLLVLFSKSGLGKSSLVNAAIIPELRKKNYEIIVCRFNSYVSKEHDDSVNTTLFTPLQKLHDEIAAKQLLIKPNAEQTFLDKLILNDGVISLWHQFKNLQITDTEKKNYFIFFDQFEELFTYPKEQVKDFKEHLAELLSASIPQEYLDKINQIESDDTATNLTDEQLSILYEPVPVKMICTIRSDKFSLLTSLKDAIPRIVTKTYELRPFNEAEAIDTIRKPALIEDDPAEDKFISDAFTYDDDAVKKMLDYLTDNGTADIESFQLQVLCRYVEEMVIESKKQGNAIRSITASQLGDIKNIFEDYYNKLIDSVDKSKIQNVKKLFEDGLIFEKDKIRVSLYEGQIEAAYGVDENLLDKLVKTHIIRCEPDTNGKEKYELSHDSLIDPILKAKDKRIAEEKVTQQKIKIRKRVELFGSIAIGIILIFAAGLIYFSRSSKRDKLEINFLVAEKDWFYLLDSAQRKNVLKNDFLFLSDKDSAKYQDIKYSFKCAAYANLNAETDYVLALKFAQEGYLKNANIVTQKSLDSLLHKPGVYFPSLKMQCSGYIHNVKLTQDKKNIIAVTTNGIFWFDATSGMLKDSLTAAAYRSGYSVFSPQGDYLLYENYYSDTTFLLNTATKQLKFFINQYKSQPHSIAFDITSGNENFFVHSNGADSIKLFSFSGDEKEAYGLPLQKEDKINELSVSPNGKYIAAGTNFGLVYLTDRESKKTQSMMMTNDSAAQMEMHADIINSISFSHNSRFVLTGASDKNIDIWNAATGHLIQTLKNNNPVLKCRFSDNDSSIISGEDIDGLITRWTKGRADTINIDQVSNNEKRAHADTGFKKENLQFFGLDSGITSVSFYNNDTRLLASSSHEISVWNLTKKTATASQVAKAKAIPSLSLADKTLWNMITPQDLSAVNKQKEILKSIRLLNDSMQNLASVQSNMTTNKQLFNDYTNLMPLLYDRLQNCKEHDLDKLDSFNLYIYMGNCYFYKLQMDKAPMNGYFKADNLNKLIQFRQAPFSLDTLLRSSFHNLFDAYAIPIGYYFKVKKYDSLLYWNNKILNDNGRIMSIYDIRNDIMIWYQYDVSFRLLLNDIAGARKSLQLWIDPRDNVCYTLTKELFEIYTNPAYHFNEAKFKQVFTAYDLKDEYNKQNITDMDAVLIRLLDEKDSRKLSLNTINNLTDFDNYIYSFIQ